MIYAEVGERLTQALLKGDFGLFRSVVALPLRIETRVGKAQRIETDAELRELFECYVNMGRLHRVTDLYRDVQFAEHVAPGELKAVFQLSILSGGTRVVAPFSSTHHLVETSEGWRIRRIEDALGQTNWLYDTPGWPGSETA